MRTFFFSLFKNFFSQEIEEEQKDKSYWVVDSYVKEQQRQKEHDDIDRAYYRQKSQIGKVIIHMHDQSKNFEIGVITHFVNGIACGKVMNVNEPFETSFAGFKKDFSKLRLKALTDLDLKGQYAMITGYCDNDIETMVEEFGSDSLQNYDECINLLASNGME